MYVIPIALYWRTMNIVCLDMYGLSEIKAWKQIYIHRHSMALYRVRDGIINHYQMYLFYLADGFVIQMTLYMW